MSHSVSPRRTRCVRVATVESCAKAKVGARKAPTIAIASLSEREIVILIIQRSGKFLEVVAGRARRALRALGRSTATHPGIATLGVAASAAAQHDQLADVDLGRVARLIFLVLPLPVFDAPLDVDLVALLDVLLDDVGQLRPLGVPADAAVPLGLLLPFTRWSVPGPTRREREARDAVSAGGGSNLRISPEISDQRHLVQASAHDASWRVK